MRVLALGPIELRDGDRAVPLGGGKPKALLAALVRRPRQVVSIDRLTGLIWDDDPPRSATALVHTYVSALRRGFAAAGAPAVLATRPPGYSLDVSAEENDIEQFEATLVRARQAERGRDFAAAAGRYEGALGLWRGTAFGGVDAEFTHAHAAGLDEERLAAEEGFARCLLALGEGSEAAARLTRFVAANPLREEARGLLMHALHDTGRHADALTVYREGRRRLLDELGVEPGVRLRELHAQILDGRLPATPVKAERVVAEPAPEVVVPRHLPPDVGDFSGRAVDLRTVLRLAAPDPDRTATPVVVISGSGGVGKSALAVHAAHRLRASYPDGQLFADLRGSDRDVTTAEVLGRFLGALGVAAADLPAGLDDRVELYRRTVSGRRLLVVLDNARAEAQVRRLLPGETGCLVIITSRSRLTGLAGAEPLELGFLSDDAALGYRLRRAGRGGRRRRRSRLATGCGPGHRRCGQRRRHGRGLGRAERLQLAARDALEHRRKQHRSRDAAGRPEQQRQRDQRRRRARRLVHVRR